MYCSSTETGQDHPQLHCDLRNRGCYCKNTPRSSFRLEGMPHKRAKRSARERSRSETGTDLAPVSKHSISQEGIPKGVSRVLNAARIQEEWKNRKRGFHDEGTHGVQAVAPRKRQKRDGDSTAEQNGGREPIHILPGESLVHFNRRVEDSMRGDIRSAIRSSSAHRLQVRKEELPSSNSLKSKARSIVPSKPNAAAPQSSKEQTGVKEDAFRSEPTRTHHNGRKDFVPVSTSAPKRLNDVVQAPPEFKKLPRGATANTKSLKGVAESERTKSQSLREGVLSMAQKAMLEEERERAIRLYREMKLQRMSG